jgi:hypothetical protein
MELTIDQQNMRQRRDLLQQPLGGKVMRGTSCRCAFHDYGKPSASIWKDNHGVYRFYFHVCNWGGDIFDVRARAQITDVGDALKESRGMEEQQQTKTDNFYRTIKAHYGIRELPSSSCSTRQSP